MSTPPDLGPLPEPRYLLGLDGDGYNPERILTESGWSDDQMRDFGQRCYMLGVAAASQWRPIETAPKDGSLFLCWVAAVRYGETDEGQPYEQDASQVDFCSWSDGPPDLPGHGYFDPCCGRIGDSQGVTHWMPLPSAPTKEGG